MMEGIRVLIVKDELIVSEEIKEMLIQNGYEVIGQAKSAKVALEILTQTPADIAITDINIKGDTDGIELAYEIVKNHSCAIIFLTAYDDSRFLDRAKKVKPAAYIVKPFEERNLKVAIEMAFSSLDNSIEEDHSSDSFFIADSIFIKDNNRFKKIRLDDVLYIEAVGSYSDIHIGDDKITLSINLKKFEERLSDPNFLRVHRSYLINTEKIDEFEGNTIYIKKNPIPLSASHREEFLKRLKLI